MSPTERENEIARLAAQGLSNKEIGKHLHIIVLDDHLPMKGDILVMDTLLNTRDFYILQQGDERIVMVPFRAISEELGYMVTCKDNIVFLGPYHTFTFSQDGYAFARRAPIELGTAPYLLDGVSYVPITYFKQVLTALFHAKLTTT